MCIGPRAALRREIRIARSVTGLPRCSRATMRVGLPDAESGRDVSASGFALFRMDAPGRSGLLKRSLK